jgi:putative ABC transport system permease protein
MSSIRELVAAVRYLRRNLAFTLTATAMMALGIGMSATLFAVVKATLIEPWPYPGYERIVTVRGNYPAQARTAFSLWSAKEIEDLRAQPDIFAQVIAGDASNVNLTYEGVPERVRAAVLTPNAFDMLGVRALLGRELQAQDARPGAPPVVVVSYDFWRLHLAARAEVIGDTLRIGDVPYEIVGVMPPRFVFWDRSLWMPLSLDARDDRRQRRYYVQAELQPGITPREAETRLRVFAARLGRDHADVAEYDGLSITLKPLVDDVLRDLRPALYALLGAVALVMLVAAANLANATLAKSLAREGELALRRALGASGLQIARQLLSESVLIAIGGAAAGAALASFLLPYVVSLIPYGYIPAEAHVTMDWRVAAAAMTVAIVCGLLLGVLPAAHAARVDPGAVLQRGSLRTGLGQVHVLRHVFTAAQITMAVVVLGCSLAAFQSLRGMVGRDPGYVSENISTARIALPARMASSGVRAAAYDSMLDALRATPSVNGVALMSEVPVGTLPRALVSRDIDADAPRRSAIDVDVLAISPEFTSLLHIPIVTGRAFVATDTGSRPPVALISARLADRLWRDEQAVGRTVALSDGRSTTVVEVVGVVGDIAPNPSDAQGRPMLLVPIAQRPPATAVVAIRSSDPASTLLDLRKAVAQVDSTIPIFAAETLRRTQLSALGPQLLAVVVMGLFGIAVLTLSAVGLFAVISQSVAERRRELGIRLALGAEPQRLFFAEVLRAARIVAASGGVGVLATAGALKVLSAAFLMFHADIATTVALALSLVASCAIGAAIVPAYRASRSDELVSLR